MNHRSGADPIYVEVQRFRQPVVLALVFLIGAGVWVLFVVQVVFGHDVGQHPASNGGLTALWLLIGVALPVWFAALKLVTEVRPSGVTVRFFPLHTRRFSWAEVQQPRLVTYRPLREFGGWGIRYGRGRRTAYTLTGDTAVEWSLPNGRRFLVGSQHADDLLRAIEFAR